MRENIIIESQVKTGITNLPAAEKRRQLQQSSHQKQNPPPPLLINTHIKKNLKLTKITNLPEKTALFSRNQTQARPFRAD